MGLGRPQAAGTTGQRLLGRLLVVPLGTGAQEDSRVPIPRGRSAHSHMRSLQGSHTLIKMPRTFASFAPRCCSDHRPLHALWSVAGQASGDSDCRGASCGWRRHCVTMRPQRCNVEPDRVGDEPGDLLATSACSNTARKIRHVSTPGIAVLLDHDHVLGHLDHRSCAPACRQIAASVPLGTSALRLPATVMVPGRSGWRY